MRRTVSAAMDLDVIATSDLVMAVSVTALPGLTVDERLVVELDGVAARPRGADGGDRHPPPPRARRRRAR